MIKVVHLIPTLAGGGAERQLAMLAAEQTARGYGVHVGCRRGGVHESVLRSSGVTIHALGDLRGLSPALLISIQRLMRQLRPDVIQTWLPQMDIMGGIAATRAAVPWVLSERASELAFKKWSVMTWLRRRIGRRASAIIANSTAGARYWNTGAAPSALVATVSNALDVAAIRNAIDAGAQFVPADQKFLLVVGRLDYQKAVEVVIEAVAAMPRRDFRVLIFGDGPLRSQLVANVNRHQLGSQVQMLAYQADWWGLLKSASGLVSMSRFEGHPNVVLETMAAGCPLIVSDIPEHREFLDSDCAILTPREDAPALAKAIAALLEDPPAARLRAERAANRVVGLTIAIAADAYESIYKQIMTGRSK